MKNKIRISLLLGLLTMLRITPVAAISIDFMPGSLSGVVGDTIAVDVVISDLFNSNEIVSAYDLDVAYDETILSATGVSFGSFLDDLLFPGFTFQDSILSTAGIVDFSEVSLLLDYELAAQQPDSFTLATISFDALMVGNSELSFEPDLQYGIDVKGRNAQILPLYAGVTNINVLAAVSVPEPATLLLLLVGLLGFRFMRSQP